MSAKLTTLELMQRAVRARVCPTCQHRPANTVDWPPTKIRDCEDRCPVMAYLPQLAQIAADQEGDPRAPFERAIRDDVCQHCTFSPTAGDYCYRSMTRSCPLSCYASQVLAAIEPLALRHCGCD